MFECWGTAEDWGSWVCLRASIKVVYEPATDSVETYYASCSRLQGPGETPIGSISGGSIAGFVDDAGARKELCSFICSNMQVEPSLMFAAIENAARKCSEAR